jgi:dihydroorotate dehydrogenase (fumarate)
MGDLSTTYMGLKLSNPLVVGSSTLTILPDKVKALEDAGAGAVVLKSIFEEQVRADVADAYEDLDAGMHPEAYEYLRADLPMQLGPEKYLERVAAIKTSVSIPVIASINCVTRTRWTAFAQRIADAGADAIELNVYDIPDDPDMPGAEVERRHLDLVQAVKTAVKIPVAVKIGPSYSSLLDFTRRLSSLGADAIVMFNRFFQPDVDVDTLALRDAVSYSREEDILLPLRWTALVRSQVSCDLCLTGGVHDWQGALKALLVGANAFQVCSVIYDKGPGHIGNILAGIDRWMEQKGYDRIGDFSGLMREQNLGDNKGFERAQYIKAFAGLE